MLIPLGTDRPLRRPTLATYLLIGATFAAFIAQLATATTDSTGQILPGDLTLSGMLWHPAARGYHGFHFHWWQFFTYQFLHSESDYLHIAGNMLILYVFGPNLEDRLGRIWFLLFYLLGGAAAGAMQLAFSHNPLVGASGSISACTGAYLVLFPRTQIKTLFLLSLGRIYQISAWWFIGFSVCWELLSQFFHPRSVFSGMSGVGGGGSGGAEVRDNVAHLAHLGGYAFGMVVALILLATRLIPREQYDLFSQGRQAYRRRQFRAAGAEAQQRMQDHWNKPKNPHAKEEADALAAARADVVAKVNAAQLPEAAAAYKKLADTFSNYIGGTTLSRRYQYEIANYFYSTKDHAAAAYAYERFLEAYPKDPEAPTIRLLLGMIHSRQLNDPIKAKQLIASAIKDLEEPSATLARQELEALG